MTEPAEARPKRPGKGADGFTLLEMLVALALFALISLAGVSLIDTVIGVHQRVDGRAGRLAEVQRAVYLIAADFEQLTGGPVSDEAGVRIDRASAAGVYPVTYRFAAGALMRGAGDGERVLLSGVSSVNWRFLHEGAWTGTATVPRSPNRGATRPEPIGGKPPERPRAVELTIALAGTGPGPRGSLRRVIELPHAP